MFADYLAYHHHCITSTFPRTTFLSEDSLVNGNSLVMSTLDGTNTT